MSTKILNSLRKEISSREKELQGLIEAFNLLSGSASGRGRKSSITSTISSLIGPGGKIKGKKKGTGKRGRPAGSKNKPNAKKPGPKTSKNKSAEAKAAPVKKEAKKGAGRPKGSVKKATGKRGRPKGKVSSNTTPASSENA